jgi:hypothetical protein
MQVKEIAKKLNKAGVKVRPKALNAIHSGIKQIDEVLRSQNMDVDADMETENDTRLSNDSTSIENSNKVIDLIIKRFKERQIVNSDETILEENTVKLIFETFKYDDIDTVKVAEDSLPKEVKKDFKSYIQETEDKIMEDKDREIQDPAFDVLTKKVIVLDSFKDVPRAKLLGQNIVYRVDAQTSILSDADSRINYFQDRMRILEGQILKDNHFERARLKHSEMQTDGMITTCLNRVNALLGSTEKLCCLGIIVTGEDGHLHLEDETMRVKLNLSKAHSDQKSYFTEGNIVLVEGEYKGKVFCADYVSHPSLIEKPTRNEIVENDNFGAYTYVKQNILSDSVLFEKFRQEEHIIDEDEGIVVISNLCLDESKSIPTLNEIFKVYECMTSISTFVLCGEFISQKKIDSLDFDGIKFSFDELANTIRKYHRIKNE